MNVILIIVKKFLVAEHMELFMQLLIATQKKQIAVKEIEAFHIEYLFV